MRHYNAYNTHGMKYLTLLIIAVASLTLLPGCGGNTSNKEMNTAEKSELATPGVATGKPTIIDFSATWCPPCRQFKPIFEKAKEQYSAQANMMTIDVDENPEMAASYGVESIPTVVFINANGEIANISVGLISEQDLDAKIRKLID